MIKPALLIAHAVFVLQIITIGGEHVAAQLDDDPDEHVVEIQYDALWLAVMRLVDDFDNGLENVQRPPCSRRGARLFCLSNVEIPSALRTQIIKRDTGELAVTCTFAADMELEPALKVFSPYAAALHSLGSAYPAGRRGGPNLRQYKGLPILVVWLPRNTVARLYLSKSTETQKFGVHLRIEGAD